MHHPTIHMNFNDLSKYRPFLYGFSTLWILLFHCGTQVPSEGILLPFSYFQSFGNCGVEIFLLLSGFGLYHSMEMDPNIGTFYKKRLLRVFLPAFLAMSAFNIVKGGTLLEYIGSSTFVGYWFGIETVWYVAFILTMYLFYPFVYTLQKKSTRNAVILFLLSLLFSFFSETFHVVDKEIQRGISRIPAFLLGCLIAPSVISKKQVSRWTLPVSFCSAMFTALLWKVMEKYGYYYFFRSLAYIVFSILAIAGLCMLARILVKYKPLHGIYQWIAFCGGISLEVYLIFERTLELLGRLPGFSAHPCGGLKLDIAAAILTLFLAVVLQTTTKNIIKSVNSCPVPESSHNHMQSEHKNQPLSE